MNITSLATRTIAASAAALVALTMTGCTDEDIDRFLEEAQGDNPSVSAPANPSDSDSTDPNVSEPADVKQDGDYYTVTGTAVREHEIADGEVDYCDLDELDRAVCAYGELTAETRSDAQARGRQPINVDPAGWPENDKVNIPALEGVADSKDYNGWMWNRSHMLGDSLGGDPIKENLVTGTRTQNVGSAKNAGGQAYTETIARDYLDSAKAKDCPLYYASTPVYEGNELLPRTVTVDIQSCDKSIDERVVVDNTANNYTIDYSNGAYVQN